MIQIPYSLSMATSDLPNKGTQWAYVCASCNGFVASGDHRGCRRNFAGKLFVWAWSDNELRHLYEHEYHRTTGKHITVNKKGGYWILKHGGYKTRLRYAGLCQALTTLFQRPNSPNFI